MRRIFFCRTGDRFLIAIYCQILEYVLVVMVMYMLKTFDHIQKDAEIQRVVLESLYRLLWVYVVRIKCEGNIPTEK